MCKYSHLRQNLLHFFYFCLCALSHRSQFTGPQALNKKENKGSESPELKSVLALTPHTEEKYKSALMKSLIL